MLSHPPSSSSGFPRTGAKHLGVTVDHVTEGGLGARVLGRPSLHKGVPLSPPKIALKMPCTLPTPAGLIHSLRL